MPLNQLRRNLQLTKEVIMVTGLGDTQRKEGFHGALRME